MFHIALGELELFIISFVCKYVFGALESILCLAPLEVMDGRNQKGTLVCAQAYLILLHFVLLHFSSVVLWFFFFFIYNMKVCGNLASNSITHPAVGTHFLSLYHILVILTKFHMFSLLLLLCLLWRSVIS